MSDKRKKNFITKRKKNYSGKFQTMFNIGVSSKALFGLSPNALKIYMLLVLNGKKTEPSIARFSKMSGMSERTISRYYQELKDKDYLKITSIGINRYKYEFDPYGDINRTFKKQKEEAVLDIKTVEDVREEKEIVSPVVEAKEELSQYDKVAIELIDKSQTIQEYEDFAVLENLYWTIDESNRDTIKRILNDRLQKEPHNKDAIEWFLNKVE